MKVRMKADISGVRDGRPWPPRGEVVEVGDQEGADLCAAGIAEPAAEQEKPETATAPEPETSTAAEPETATAPEPEKRAPGRPRKQV